MILSNLEIQQAIDDKRLIIEPEPLPRKPIPSEPECPYNTTSVDLRLHSEISIPKPSKFAYDLTEPGAISEMITKHSEKLVLQEDNPYKLKKGRFIVAWTLETVELCITKEPCLAARIEGKSSRARCGVLIHFTAPTVHAGWKGRLTLEMINLGPTPFLLVPGMPIAQLILEEVRGKVKFIPSQFQNQSSPEGLVIN